MGVRAFAVAVCLLVVGCGDDSVGPSSVESGLAQGEGVDTFSASKDSYLSKPETNRNHGAEHSIVISRGRHEQNRGVVAFELSDVPISVTRATLVLTLRPEHRGHFDSCDHHQGRFGHHPPCDAKLVVQTLRNDWTEGERVPRHHSRTHTDVDGVTWNCPTDRDIGNHRRDCQQDWNGGHPANPPTATSVRVLDRQRGTIAFDVTQDVINGAPFGWVISAVRGEDTVRFYSREGAQAAGDPTLAPRLVLENPTHTVDPTGGCVRANGGKVVLCIPAGALATPAPIQITRAPIEASLTESGLVPGTLYDFTPHGLQFALPATLSIAFDATLVRAGVAPESLIILSSVHGSTEELTPFHLWEERPSTADVAAGRVTGTIEHFSHDGVGEPAVSLLLSEPGGQGAEVTMLDMFVGDERPIIAQPCDAVCATPLAHVVDWASANPCDGSAPPPVADAAPRDIGLVTQQQGLITACGPGDTTVTATVRNSPSTLNVTKEIDVQVKARGRRIVFSGSVALSNCVCGNPMPNNATHPLDRVCEVNSDDPVDTVSVSHNEFCSNQIGLDFIATCTLLDDNSVRVRRQYDFFEGSSGSCGDGSPESSGDFTQTIAPDETLCRETEGEIETLCGTLATCHDTYRANFCMLNQSID